MTFTVRLADDSEGHRIHELVRETGFSVEDVDFSEVYPYWLVVASETEILGCIQVCPGKPLGRLELMSADKRLSGRDRAKVVKLLVTSGNETLRQGGSKLVAGMVQFGDSAWKRLLKKRGAVVIGTGNMLASRL